MPSKVILKGRNAYNIQGNLLKEYEPAKIVNILPLLWNVDIAGMDILFQ